MTPDRVRAVVFDVGNTLWFEARRPEPTEIERLRAQPLRSLLATWGVALSDPEEIVRAVHNAGVEAERGEQARGSLREVSIPFLLRAALPVRRIDISADQADELWRATWILERNFGMQLYPDTLDVLATLNAQGLLIDINTNRPCTSEMHAAGLRDLGIAPFVDAVVCSGDTGFVKPHPSTFGLVLERLGVAASEAVMVGNSAGADMHGAKSVGMRTVWKLNARYDLPPCPYADYAIHDLAELLWLPIVPRRLRSFATTESLTPHDDGNEDRY